MTDLTDSYPLRILQTLDHFLNSPFELIVYARSAFALGYPHSPLAYSVTMHVDAILPASDVKRESVR